MGFIEGLFLWWRLRILMFGYGFLFCCCWKISLEVLSSLKFIVLHRCNFGMLILHNSIKLSWSTRHWVINWVTNKCLVDWMISNWWSGRHIYWIPLEIWLWMRLVMERDWILRDDWWRISSNQYRLRMILVLVQENSQVYLNRFVIGVWVGIW